MGVDVTAIFPLAGCLMWHFAPDAPHQRREVVYRNPRRLMLKKAGKKDLVSPVQVVAGFPAARPLNKLRRVRESNTPPERSKDA